MGGVGRQIVELLRAVGMRADLMGRTGREDPEAGVGNGVAALGKFLPETDDFVLATLLMNETQDMIGGAEL